MGGYGLGDKGIFGFRPSQIIIIIIIFVYLDIWTHQKFQSKNRKTQLPFQYRPFPPSKKPSTQYFTENLTNLCLKKLNISKLLESLKIFLNENFSKLFDDLSLRRMYLSETWVFSSENWWEFSFRKKDTFVLFFDVKFVSEFISF